MIVKLIACTQPIREDGLAVAVEPVSIVEEAASVCYDSEPTNDYRIAKSCMKSGHYSVFEHISFVFKVEGVSRSLLAQLSRHRHIGLSVRSQRYCVEDLRQSTVVPHKLNGNEIFQRTIDQIADSYDELIENGAEPEDARSVLPNACATTLYISCNARALIEMSGKRLCTRAQKEIRDMFKAFKREVEKVSPIVAGYMRPQCMVNDNYPFCTESKCCGLSPKLAEVYKREE